MSANRRPTVAPSLGTRAETPWRPTRVQLEQAAGQTLRDVIADDLDVLFCGINPSLYSAAVGHHFARPGNRFWPTLQGAGFTDRLLSPFEDRLLLGHAIGVTNLVPRATATAAELGPEEILSGGKALSRKILRRRPRALVILGLGTYRLAFAKKAELGRQPEGLAATQVWALPNPSGLQAHYQLPDLIELFSLLRSELGS